ncbi:MAG: SRPBCC family protein, partial [Bacteroidota bacterium]
LLLAIVTVLGILAPKEMTVARSVVVDAPAATVYKYISTFEQTNRWQPWMQLDPSMKSGINGTDGEVGTTYWWEGNGDVGKGEQVVKAIVPNKSVEVDLRFIEPWESSALAKTELEEVEGGTKVTWGFSSPMSFPMNIMGLFMTGALEADYDKGLANLKTLVEEEKDKAPAYEVRTVDFPATQLVALRKEMPISEMGTFIQTEMPKIGEAVIGKNIEMAGTAMALTYKWDQENEMTETAVAIPVNGEQNVGGDYEFIEIAEGKALVIDYYGEYDGSVVAHEAMDAYLAANGLSFKMPVIEEYVTDPTTEPDPSKWLTRIYYFLEG